MKIILASQSPRRREILQLMEIPFEVIESHVQEIPPVGASPEELVKAKAKTAPEYRISSSEITKSSLGFNISKTDIFERLKSSHYFFLSRA